MSLPRREHMRRACNRVHALVRIVASPIMFTCVAYMVVATLSCLFVSVQGMTPRLLPRQACVRVRPPATSTPSAVRSSTSTRPASSRARPRSRSTATGGELTHGRVGMLASAGFLVQEKFHLLSRATAVPPSTRSRSIWPGCMAGGTAPPRPTASTRLPAPRGDPEGPEAKSASAPTTPRATWA